MRRWRDNGCGNRGALAPPASAELQIPIGPQKHTCRQANWIVRAAISIFHMSSPTFNAVMLFANLGSTIFLAMLRFCLFLLTNRRQASWMVMAASILRLTPAILCRSLAAAACTLRAFWSSCNSQRTSPGQTTNKRVNVVCWGGTLRIRTQSLALTYPSALSWLSFCTAVAANVSLSFNSCAFRRLSLTLRGHSPKLGKEEGKEGDKFSLSSGSCNFNKSNFSVVAAGQLAITCMNAAAESSYRCR